MHTAYDIRGQAIRPRGRYPGTVLHGLVVGTTNNRYVSFTLIQFQCSVLTGKSGTIMMIYDAITGSHPHTIPNIEFPFCADDDAIRAHRGISWGYTRHNSFEDQRQVWVIPDFGYWEWYSSQIYSYDDARKKILKRANELTWGQRKDKMIWRGATKFNPIREKLVNQVQDKSWGDAMDCAGGPCFVKLEDHCNYKFILHTEGATYSGRMKYLQQCKSALIMHTVHWITHFSHLLHWEGPQQNVIKVEDDWTDLEEKIEYYLGHPEEAQAVAKRGYKLFAERYQTPAAISCYFRSLFDAWGANQGYEVKLYDENGRKRGVPFESWAIARTYLGNDPHLDS
jgi:EGF-domain serine glucosyl/xylosyltransferase